MEGYAISECKHSDCVNPFSENGKLPGNPIVSIGRNMPKKCHAWRSISMRLAHFLHFYAKLYSFHDGTRKSRLQIWVRKRGVNSREREVFRPDMPKVEPSPYWLPHHQTDMEQQRALTIITVNYDPLLHLYVSA